MFRLAASLPQAKALAALVILCLCSFLFSTSPALAQYGGGGYPGGTTFGWSAQRKPYDSQYPYLSTYDWNGLHVHVDRTYFDSSYGLNGTANEDYRGWGGVDYHYPVEYTYGGVGGSNSADGPGLVYSSLTVSDYSSFRWHWTPPYIPGTTTPDTDNFPAPPLYVLGRITGSLEFRPYSSKP